MATNAQIWPLKSTRKERVCVWCKCVGPRRVPTPGWPMRDDVPPPKSINAPPRRPLASRGMSYDPAPTTRQPSVEECINLLCKLRGNVENDKSVNIQDLRDLLVKEHPDRSSVPWEDRSDEFKNDWSKMMDCKVQTRFREALKKEGGAPCYSKSPLPVFSETGGGRPDRNRRSPQKPYAGYEAAGAGGTGRKKRAPPRPPSPRPPPENWQARYEQDQLVVAKIDDGVLFEQITEPKFKRADGGMFVCARIVRVIDDPRLDPDDDPDNHSMYCIYVKVVVNGRDEARNVHLGANDVCYAVPDPTVRVPKSERGGAEEYPILAAEDFLSNLPDDALFAYGEDGTTASLGGEEFVRYSAAAASSQGVFGVVHHYVNDNGNIHLAVKQIKNTIDGEHEAAGVALSRLVRCETVPVRSVPLASDSSQAVTVMPHGSGGDLSSLRGHVQLPRALAIAQALYEQATCLKLNGFRHQDIKVNNCVWFPHATREDSIRVALADLGSVVPNIESSVQNSTYVSPLWDGEWDNTTSLPDYLFDSYEAYMCLLVAADLLEKSEFVYNHARQHIYRSFDTSEKAKDAWIDWCEARTGEARTILGPLFEPSFCRHYPFLAQVSGYLDYRAAAAMA